MAETARRTGIADVAREAGVSKTTVSFAFNSPERLSAATVDRIRSVADSLGYRPNPVARMLTAGQTTTIGILSPQVLGLVFANPFFWLFAEGVASVTEEHGFGLLFISPLHGSLSRALERATVDGIVAIGVDETHPEVESVRRAGLPIVLVDTPAWPEHGSVVVDDEGGARMAALHLLALGHREIVVIAIQPPAPLSESTPDSVIGRRLRGYRSAFAEYGRTLDEERIIVAPTTFEGGEAAYLRAWQEGLRPTGILAMSDATAAGVLQAARQLGRSVPQDLSVVGFDDLPLTRITDPPLTTVHQPVRQKGEEAARILLEGLTPRVGGVAEHRTLPTRLVVRGSTAPPGGPAGQEVATND